MENPRPVGKDTVVAIAVKKGSISQAALKWTIDNLLMEGHSVKLVHVRPKVPIFSQKMRFRAYEIDAFSGPDVRKGLEEGFKDILSTRAEEMLLPFQSYCKKKNILSDLVLLEDDDMVGAIADFILAHHVDVLVVGAGSQHGLLKRLKGPDVATRVSKKAPYFCTVYIISKGRLLSVRSASSAAHALPSNNINILEHESCYHEPLIGDQSTRHRSSVSSRTALLRPDLEKEFEFRSPLQNFGDSHFGIGGLSDSESDISFVSSDRQFYDNSFSSSSDNSSNWGIGSFATSYASSNSSNWSIGSFGSSDSDSVCDSTDELQRLRLDLMKTKKMYDSVCNEAPDAKMLSSDMASLNLEEDPGMEKSQKPPRHQSQYTRLSYK